MTPLFDYLGNVLTKTSLWVQWDMRSLLFLDKVDVFSTAIVMKMFIEEYLQRSYR